MSEQNTAVAVREPQQLLATRSLQDIQQALTSYRDKAHLLTPFCRTPVKDFPEDWDVSIRTLVISTSRDSEGKYPDQKVYPIEGTGRLGLTKIGLWKLEQLAGIKWLWLKRQDEKEDSRFCSYQACAEVTDVDGTRREVTDGFDYDLRDGSDRVEAMKGKPKQLAMARQNIDQLCITKAKLRVLRAILGIQSSYKPEELQKPFVILKMQYKGGLDDPMIRRALAMKQHGIEKEVFALMQAEGSRPPQIGEPVHPAALPAIQQPMNLQLPPMPGDNPALETHLTLEELAAAQKQEEREDLIRKIDALYLAKKGATRAQFSPTKPPLSELSDENLTEIEKTLSELPDIGKGLI